MSGIVEVIGSVASIITILETSVKIYASARKDLNLPEAFIVVRRRLPIVRDTLQTCERQLGLVQTSLPADVCVALKQILDSCEEKAKQLHEISEKVIRGDNDGWDKRYSKILRRLGKGKRVEDLMAAISEDVQLIVNNHMVKSAIGELGQALYVDPKPKRYFVVPRPVEKFFTGREDLLRELGVAFDPCKETTEQKRFVISGLPGSGKTEFCYKFANQYRELYWGVFTIDASSHNNAVNSFHQAMQYVTGKDVHQDLRFMKQWFTDQEQPWLLILDNADDPRLQIEEYLPSGNRGCVLINTRNQSLQSHGTVGRNFYHFEGLEGNEAQSLLLKAANELRPYRVQVMDAASRISNELCGLPLALVFAGKAIRDRLCTWKSYLNWYKETKVQYYEKVQQSAGGDFESVSLTIIPTFEPLLMQLEQSSDRTDTQSLELLYTLAYFHHNNISIDLLTKIVQNAHYPDFILEGEESRYQNQDQKFIKQSIRGYNTRLFSIYSWLFVGKSAIPNVLSEVKPSDNLSIYRIRRVLRRLLELGLIRGGEEEDLYSLHPLVHSWVKSRLSKLWRRAVWCEAANRALADSVVLNLEMLSARRQEQSYFDPQQIYPHLVYARTCKEEIDKEFKDRQAKARRPSWLPLISTGQHFLTLRDHALQLIKYGAVYAQCGKYQDALVLHAEARNYMVTHYGMNDEYSIHATVALAFFQRLLGSPLQAFPLQQEVVNACKIVYGPDHMHTICMLNLLGLFAFQNEQLLEAKIHLKKALSVFNDSASTTGTNWKIRQKYQGKALATRLLLAEIECKFFQFQKAMEICEAVLHEVGQHSQWHITRAKEVLMEICYWSGNQYQERAYQVALSVKKAEEKTYGRNHPLSLWASLRVCRALWCLKRYDEGLGIMEQLLSIGEVAVGKDHWGYKFAEMLKGAMLRDKGLCDEALPLLVRSEKTFAEKSLYFYRIDALLHLMRLFEVQMKYQEMIATASTIKSIVQQIFPGESGTRHPLYLRVNEQIERLQPMVSLNSVIQADGETLASDQGLRQRRDGPINDTDAN